MSASIPPANSIIVPPTPKKNNSRKNVVPPVMDPIPVVSPAPEGEKGFFGKMTNTMKGLFGFSGGGPKRRRSKRKSTKRKTRRGSMRRKH